MRHPTTTSGGGLKVGLITRTRALLPLGIDIHPSLNGLPASASLDQDTHPRLM